MSIDINKQIREIFMGILIIVVAVLMLVLVVPMFKYTLSQIDIEREDFNIIRL